MPATFISPPTNDPPGDRRSHLRLHFDCPVRWNSGAADRPGLARDVSESGAGFTVRSLSAPAVGDRIRVVFEMEPTREWVLDETARVTRCDPRQDGFYDVGVALTPLPS